MDPSIYPTFDAIQDRGLIPHIPLPENYRSLVFNFWGANGKRTVENYVAELEKALMTGAALGDARVPRGLDIRLQWDKYRGLTNISVGSQGGLDLNDNDQFQEHNLSTGNGMIAGLIAMRYVAELITAPDIRTW